MADEPKRSTRSSSTGGTRKGRAKSSSASAASSKADTAAEKPAQAASAAPAAPAAAAPPQEAATASASAAPATTAAASAAASPPPRSSATPSQPPIPAASSAAAESSGSGGVALAGLIAGVIGIVLALTYPQWTPVVYGASGSDTADQVRAELKGEIEGLKATIQAMTDKQVSLEQGIRTAKLPGVLMVAEDLRAALGDSEPYAGTLNLFRSLTGGDAEAAPIIAAVEGRAEVGVPSVGEIQESFDEVAHAVLMAEQRPTATGDLASQVSDTVASLTAATMRLRWRLDGAPSGDGVPAVIARAELAVANGELQLAVDTLGLLPDERSALAKSWVEKVQARTQAEAVREELDAYIISMAARIQ